MLVSLWMSKDVDENPGEEGSQHVSLSQWLNPATLVRMIK